MSAGTPRKASIDGLQYNITGDADISLTPRVVKEDIAHTGGNMHKRTLESGKAEAVKFTLTPANYVVLRAQSEDFGDKALSYTMADGSVFDTVGEINIGPYQTSESSCEVEFLTSTGIWDISSKS